MSEYNELTAFRGLSDEEETDDNLIDDGDEDLDGDDIEEEDEVSEAGEDEI